MVFFLGVPAYFCQFVDRFFSKLGLNCNKIGPLPIKLFAQSLHRAKTFMS